MLIQLAGLALATLPGVNSAEPYDPNDPDVAVVEMGLRLPEFQQVCDAAYVTTPLLEVALGADAASYAAELVVAWNVELLEDGLGRNLSWDGEIRYEQALYDCIDYGVAL